MFLSALAAAPATVDTRPNIVLILADDVGYGELTSNNSQSITPTPFIDQLANTGVRFTNAHVTSPVCGPSRAGLLTGKYPSRFGFEMNGGEVNATGFYGLPLTESILPQRMQSAGYVTAGIGKWHMGWYPGMQPQQRGFDETFVFPG